MEMAAALPRHETEPARREKVWAFLLGLIVFSSAFVRTDDGGTNLAQPAPYDLLMAAAIGLYALTGPRLPAALSLPAAAWGLIIAGYGIAAMTATDLREAANYILVTTYLALSLLFLATAIYNAGSWLAHVIWWAYAAAAFVSAAIAVSGYFGVSLPGDVLLYGRAQAFFNDPNVFGAYMVPPTLWVFYRMTLARPWWALALAAALTLMALGLFLSFSRGAWGHFALSAIVLLGLIMARTKSVRQKNRLFLTLVATVAAGVGGLFWALATPEIADLLSTRASLVQDYDVGYGGRFTGQRIALVDVLAHPLGFGPGRWPEEFGFFPHNVYLNVALAGGWLSGLVFLVFCVGSVAAATRLFLREPAPNGPLLVAIASAAGLLAEGLIIDTDNWRHLFLVFGLLWASIAIADGERTRRLARMRHEAWSRAAL